MGGGTLYSPPHKQANMDCLDCLDCSICYDAINATTGVATLSCSHSFHISCIAGWFAKLEKGSCPCCRKEMSALEDVPQSTEAEDEDEDDSDDDEEDNVEFSCPDLDVLMRARGGQGMSEAMAAVLHQDGICFSSSSGLNLFLIGNGARPLTTEEWEDLLDGEYEGEKVRWCLHEDGSWVKDPINPEEITAVVVNVSPSESAAVVATSAATKVQAVWRAFKGRQVALRGLITEEIRKMCERAILQLHK